MPRRSTESVQNCTDSLASASVPAADVILSSLKAEHCAQMAKDAVDPRRRSALETESRLWLQIAVTEEDLDRLRKKAKNLLNARASQKVGSSRSG
jgi:hypothetical protein